LPGVRFLSRENISEHCERSGTHGQSSSVPEVRIRGRPLRDSVPGQPRHVPTTPSGWRSWKIDITILLEAIYDLPFSNYATWGRTPARACLSMLHRWYPMQMDCIAR